MYANAAALPRPEISAFLEEAQGTEKRLIAEKVLPVYTSDRRVGSYPRLRIEGGGELLKRESTHRAPRGSYNEVNRKFVWDEFQCEDRGLEELVDDVNAAEMKNFFDAEVITAKLIRRSLMLDYEIRVAEKIMDPTTFNATVATTDYTEANIATIDFAKDITDAKTRMIKKGVQPNTLIMSREIMDRLRRVNKLQTFMFGNLPNGHQRIIQQDDIGGVFGFENVLIADGYYDSAIKNTAGSINLTNCWGNDYIALVDVQSGEFQNGGVGRTIVWSADAPGGLYSSESYRAEDRRGDMVRIRMHTAEKIISDLCCELITTNFA